MAPYPGFCGPSYRPQSTFVDCERLVNWHVQRNQAQGARSQFALYPTPGVESYVDATESNVRALFGISGRVWSIVAGTVYEAFAARTLTARGAVAIDGYPGTLTTNGNEQLLVTSGTTGYVLDTTTQVLTAVVTGATMGGMLDTFFLVLDTATGTVQLSRASNGLLWDEAFQRSSAPDPFISMLVANSKIYFFGEATAEVWYNAGASPVPFVPFAGALIPYGIAAIFSAADVGGDVVWLSKTAHGAYRVVRASGYATAEPISTDALEYALKRYARVDDAEGWSYHEDGTDFYVLNLPAANATWVFDDAGGWHERGTWNIAQSAYDVWHPRCHVHAFGEHLVGDRNTGSIFRMATDLGLDAGGGPLRRMRIGPPLPRNLARAGRTRPWIIDRFSVGLEPGLGTVSGQGVDPQILFAKSKNGGKTWGNWRSRSAGAMGHYSEQPFWGRVGAALDFAPQIVVSDPIPWRITDADIQVRAA